MTESITDFHMFCISFGLSLFITVLWSDKFLLLILEIGFYKPEVIDQALPVSFIFIKPAIWGIGQNTKS